MVRAHAKEWRIDPNRIGIMGFSAGAELAAASGDLLRRLRQSQPRSRTIRWPASVRAPISSASSIPARRRLRGGDAANSQKRAPCVHHLRRLGRSQHAVWADEYFAAMLAASVPNIEMHIYANGHHPGSGSTGGLTDRLGHAVRHVAEPLHRLVPRFGFLAKARHRNPRGHRRGGVCETATTQFRTTRRARCARWFTCNACGVNLSQLAIARRPQCLAVQQRLFRQPGFIRIVEHHAGTRQFALQRHQPSTLRQCCPQLFKIVVTEIGYQPTFVLCLAMRLHVFS